MTAAEERELINLYIDGVTKQKLQSMFKISQHTLSKILQKYGY